MPLLHGSPAFLNDFPPRMLALASSSIYKFRGLVAESTTCFVGQDRGSDRSPCLQ